MTGFLSVLSKVTSHFSKCHFSGGRQSQHLLPRKGGAEFLLQLTEALVYIQITNHVIKLLAVPQVLFIVGLTVWALESENWV